MCRLSDSFAALIAICADSLHILQARNHSNSPIPAVLLRKPNRLHFFAHGLTFRFILNSFDDQNFRRDFSRASEF